MAKTRSASVIFSEDAAAGSREPVCAAVVVAPPFDGALIEHGDPVEPVPDEPTHPLGSHTPALLAMNGSR